MRPGGGRVLRCLLPFDSVCEACFNAAAAVEAVGLIDGRNAVCKCDALVGANWHTRSAAVACQGRSKDEKRPSGDP